MSQQRIITIGEDVYNTRKDQVLVNDVWVGVWKNESDNYCFTENELDAYKVAYSLSMYGGPGSPFVNVKKIHNKLWQVFNDS